MAAPFLACMAMVAQLYDLPPRVLPSIHAVEGGGIGVIHHNANGTDDFGVMQINTLWLPRLSRLTGEPVAAVRAQLLSSPCYNISAAGMILRDCLDETGGDLMRAIGNYHSHTPVHNQGYQAKVMRAVLKVVQREGAR